MLRLSCSEGEREKRHWLITLWNTSDHIISCKRLEERLACTQTQTINNKQQQLFKRQTIDAERRQK
jgi:hypothetical protein